MKKRLLVESQTTTLSKDFDLYKCIPTETDFQKVALRFNNYLNNGEDADLLDTPEGLALCIKDNYRLWRYYFVAALIKYTELVTAIQKKLQKKFSKEQAKEILDYAGSHLANHRTEMLIGRFTPRNTSNSTLTEATLDPYEQEKKMDKWHNGTRGANVKSMSDDKLKMNYSICVRKGYSWEANQLKHEAQSRGLSWASAQQAAPQQTTTNTTVNQTQTQATPQLSGQLLQATFSRIVLSPADFDSNTIQRAKNDIENLCQDGLEPFERSQLVLKNLIRNILLATCLGDQKIATRLKDTLIALSGNVLTAQDVTNKLNETITNPAILSILNQILAERNLNESLKKNFKLQEDIEKHDELNPKLFENGMLKSEVKEKVEEIADEFLSRLEDDGISIDVQDIILVGSNCSYNYTKDSDLDVHIVANNIEAPENLYEKVYSAYRSIFNKNIDIDFYGIPVELYVQTEDTPMNSNGIYSVMNDEWIKEPVQEDIPEIDMDAFNKEFKVWENRYNKIIASSSNKINQKEETL